ncbi:MAG: DNA translocase FtsK 4TM domain-containing protein [Candidatus Omnitrophica bacterium]|nr:DNA translocase FtsK 4TM domain-containing protein [Candidatus Omnitrophota bacterium]
MKQERINEIWGVLLFALSVLVFVSLVTYDPNDLRIFTSNPNVYTHNYAGIIGAYVAMALFSFVGFSAYIIPALTLTWSLGKFLNKVPQKFYFKFLGTCFLFIASSALLSLACSPQNSAVKVHWGGLLGLFFSDFFVRYLGPAGAWIMVIVLGALSILLATELLIFPIVMSLVSAGSGLFSMLFKKKPGQAKEKRIEKPEAQSPLRRSFEQIKAEIAKGKEAKEKSAVNGAKAAKEEPKVLAEERTTIIDIKKIIKKEEPKPAQVKVVKQVIGDYKLPDMNLLDSPPPLEERKISEDLDASAKVLEDTLADFGIEVKITAVERGPVITRYELEPAPGVKVTKITSLSDDIALAMKAQSVRIVAPIPGKARVGVEVPNSSSSLVYLKEILQSSEFQNSKSKLTLALGKDIAGTPVVADLGEMPHMLIAGTTGSGKTVCVNSIISSMLFNASPDEVKFLMVDPKMVELAMFNGLPHLLCPVVTDHKKVSGALNWVVSEMDSRYRLFARLSVRNIEFFHEKLSKGEFKDQEEVPEVLPYIVVIIDELADLMLVAPQEVENAITRLSQLSRAVGIHIILATQRPSVDVVTGVIKANFPARISFKVASKVDSRTVLDMNGADKLLGKGDMLFMRPGDAKPTRAQACLVKDREIERVISFIKQQRTAEYDEEIQKEQEKKSHGKTYEKDEMYEEAVRMVLETKQASVSMLQRRLGLGYTRAARLVDTMEAEGIVGPYNGSKPRDILIDTMEAVKAKWNQSGRE